MSSRTSRYRRPVGTVRQGMTLVEMLVAMSLSLIIILAVTQVFRLVGDNVLASRAVTEMAGQLRTAGDQLRSDLSGVTVPVRPWTDATMGEGYFEIMEGPFWDMGLGAAAALAPPFPPADPTNPRPIPWYAETGVGDVDDVIMFTAHARGTPFAGQVLGVVSVGPGNRLILNYDPTVRTVLTSSVAEIAWFTRFNDWNGNTRPDPGEVTLHRRTFLVLPNLDITDPGLQTLTPGQFFSGFDLSIRYQETTPSTYLKIPNSLQTLSLRENRTGHQIAGATPVSVPGALNQPFPYRLSRALLAPQGTALTPGADGDWGVAGVDDDGNGVQDDIGEAGWFGSDDLALPMEAVYADPWAVTLGESYGSDVILSQVLAFDVKVFDPEVTVQQTLAATSQSALPPTPEAVLPGDPGYLLAGTPVGHGGYVDLFYARYVPGAMATPNAASVSSVFAKLPHLRSGMQQLAPTPPVVWGLAFPDSHGSVYDTWATFYEHDGIDQDGNGIVDQSTNGVDDDDANGVDDPGERETSPPYPVPLRSVQVRLRIIDPDSRQVRQVTVTSDFTPE